MVVGQWLGLGGVDGVGQECGEYEEFVYDVFFCDCVVDQGFGCMLIVCFVNVSDGGLVDFGNVLFCKVGVVMVFGW